MFVSSATRTPLLSDYVVLDVLCDSTSSQGVLNNHFREGANDPTPVDMLVSGTVPAGSGLSSSAAMVVASTLSFLAANEILDGLTKGKLVEIAVANENRVGVNSGG